MNEDIKNIVDEILENEPELADDEAKLAQRIESLKNAKPNANIDEGFKRRLGEKLKQKAEKKKKGARLFRSIFYNKVFLSAAAVVIVSISAVFYMKPYEKEEQPQNVVESKEEDGFNKKYAAEREMSLDKGSGKPDKMISALTTAAPPMSESKTPEMRSKSKIKKIDAVLKGTASNVSVEIGRCTWEEESLLVLVENGKLAATNSSTVFQAAKDYVMEMYTGKTNLWIYLVRTPQKAEGLNLKLEYKNGKHSVSNVNVKQTNSSLFTLCVLAAEYLLDQRSDDKTDISKTKENTGNSGLSDRAKELKRKIGEK